MLWNGADVLDVKEPANSDISQSLHILERPGGGHRHGERHPRVPKWRRGPAPNVPRRHCTIRQVLLEVFPPVRSLLRYLLFIEIMPDYAQINK